MAKVTITEPAGVACPKCGYWLEVPPATGRCPDCGTRWSGALRNAPLLELPPAHVERLILGVMLVIAATVLILLATGIAYAVEKLQPGSTIVIVLSATGLIGSFVVSVIGWWLFTSPEPSWNGEGEDSKARLLVRGMLAFIAFSLIVLPLGFFVPAFQNGMFAIIVIACSILAFVAYIVMFFAALVYIRWLAGRVASDRVRSRAGLCLWLHPILITFGTLLVVGPLIALVLYLQLLNWIRKDLKAIRGRQGGLSPA